MSPASTRTSSKLTINFASVLAVLALGCAVGACASSGARKRAERQPKPAPTQAPAPAPTTTAMGPRTPEASEQPELAGTSGSAPAPVDPIPAPAASQETVTADAPRPAAGSAARAPSGSREDGRPNWWFADSRRGDGRVQLCAEALGVDMVAARDASLQTARARIRRELGLADSSAVPGERIERAWVWPLPNSRVGPSRYAGYVLISASAAGAD